MQRLVSIIVFLAMAWFLVADAAMGAEKETGSSLLARVAASPSDWPWWRGPSLNGVADPNQSPPLKWSEDENVVWKIPVPGRGHGSPTVCGNAIYLATAETGSGIQSVICYDRQTGNQLWKKAVHQGGLSLEGLKAHEKASLASSTAACDGERLFINFYNNGAVYTTALALNGEQLWQKKISDYIMHQGFGSSPMLYESLVIVSADNKSGGALVALDRATGEEVWRNDRPKFPNYTSPILLTVAGREQLFLIGCNLISSFEPSSGKKLWEVAGATTECVTSTVTDGSLIFSSGGFPKSHVAAISADGSGKVVWEKNARVYVPSMLIKDGYLYAVLDAGVATCWKCATGETAWSHRLGGNFTGSPVLVGENIFATNEAGQTYVFKADPLKFQLVAQNEIPAEVLASPTICGSRIYLRLAKEQGGKRQEFLYCLGNSK